MALSPTKSSGKPYTLWKTKSRQESRPYTVQCGRFSYRICVDDHQLRSSSMSRSMSRSSEFSKQDDSPGSAKQSRRAQTAEPAPDRRDSPHHDDFNSKRQPPSVPNIFPQFSGSTIHSTRMDNSKQLSYTESWAHKQFFSRPETRQQPLTINVTPWESRYVPHPQTEVGRPSIEWMCSVSPRLASPCLADSPRRRTDWICVGSQWPRETMRPNTGKMTGLTDSRYLQSLNSKVLDALEGRTSLSTTKEERELRRRAEMEEDATVVRGLQTPQAGVREQLLEEILRQLQGDGPMEKLQDRLLGLDRRKSGVVSIQDFRMALNDLGEKSVLQEKHYTFLLEQAGTHEDWEGNTVVHYKHFLELLRLARNRAMASLQKATEVKKKGLMRWMHNRSLRILKAWRLYAKSKRHPSPKHL